MQIFNIILLSSALCTLTLIANAQTSPATQTKDHYLQVTDIEEQHFPDFQNIHKLNKYANITYTGVDSSSTVVDGYRLEGHTPHIALKALYNKDGSLNKSVLVKTNTKLPVYIYRALAAQETADWSMVANKTVVIDFNPTLTQYKVIVQKGTTQKALYFNSQGVRVDGLTDLPQFASFNEDNLALLQ